MSPRILFFTGAPESRFLHWHTETLHETFSSAFQRFTSGTGGGHPESPPCYQTSTSTSSANRPAWRSLPLEQNHLPTGHSQLHHYHQISPEASFFNASALTSFHSDPSQDGATSSLPPLSNTQPASNALSQFYEQSYAVHEDIPSSQILAASTNSSTDSDTSFITESSFTSPLPTRPILEIGPLTSLKDIPPATYLQSIQPQTMTVNLIIGIISAPAPRTIRTRRGADVDLVELLVGDETRSGFGLNFWLPPSSNGASEFRSVLTGLRPQDVILVRNVALGSFRGSVFGQSLRRGMTKCVLLHRQKLKSGRGEGLYSARELEHATTGSVPLQKTRMVSEWVLRSVGVGDARWKEDGNDEFEKEVLPPDTQ